MTEPFDPDEPTQFVPPVTGEPRFDPGATQAVPPVAPTGPPDDVTRVVPAAGEPRTRAYIPAPVTGPGGPGGPPPASSPSDGRGSSRRDPIDRALVIGIVAVLAVIIGLGAYLLGRSNSNKSGPGTTTTSSSVSTSSTVAPTTTPNTTAATDTTQPAQATTTPATTAPATTRPATTLPATTVPPTTTPATAAPTTPVPN